MSTLNDESKKIAIKRSMRYYDDPYMSRDDYINHREKAIEIFGKGVTYKQLAAVAYYGDDAKLIV